MYLEESEMVMLMVVTFYEDPTKLVGCTYCFT